MSKYTTEVRFICEAAAGLAESKGFDDIDTILTTAAPLVFNFDFPIWDNNYKLTLEKKILRHYYTREISEETVGLWKLRLWDKLNLIMPYYNQLYETTTLEYNPLYDVDYRKEHEGQNAGQSSEQFTTTDSRTDGRTLSSTENLTDDSTNNRDLAHTESGVSHGQTETDVDKGNTNWDLYSDTPQGGIEGVAGTISTPGYEDTNYLTNVRKTTSATDVDNTQTTEDRETSNTLMVDEDTTFHRENERNYSTTEASNMQNTNQRQGGTAINNTDEYIDHVFGKMSTKPYSTLVMEFRKALLNIDQMIINELSELFFGLW